MVEKSDYYTRGKCREVNRLLGVLFGRNKTAVNSKNPSFLWEQNVENL